MKEHYLYPGKLFSSSEPVKIRTILGSCVAVALYDPVARVGGLNHYLLAKCPNTENPNPRYGSFAIQGLVKELLARGAERERLKAKVFGGGAVLSQIIPGIDVGQNNVDFAFLELENLKIPVLEKNVLGELGRKIEFDLSSFNVKHEFMASTASGRHEVATSGFSVTTQKQKVRVVIVDDSATVRTIFQKIFDKHGIDVVGVAPDPYAAREVIVKTKPDVVTLDIEMPNMSGVAFLEKLMKHFPLPVVMVSSLDSQGEAAMRAMELGAIEFVEKPSQFDPAVLRNLAEVLVEKVRAAANSEVKINQVSSSKAQSTSLNEQSIVSKYDVKIVAVTGNVGSQDAIKSLIKNNKVDAPPMVISNSTIAPLLKDWLNSVRSSGQCELVIAQDGMSLKMGTIYFAPPGAHLEIAGSSQTGFKCQLIKSSPVDGHLPSGTVLLKSVARVAGRNSVGVVLSGFGRDGVEGLMAIQSQQGTTIVMNPTECSYPYSANFCISGGFADVISNETEMSQILWKLRNDRAA